MNSNTDIDQIIANFLSGSLTDFERERLKAWESKSAKNTYQLEELRKLWKERSQERKTINASELKRSIWSKGVKEDSKQFSIRQTGFYQLLVNRKVAATIIFFLVIGGLYFAQQHIPTKEANTENQEYISKINPPGQKLHIQLPDGSKVWLNADSRISYKENFADSIRAINLEGEAYFEVMRDSLHPFLVHTDKLSVSVLGTGFNVCAYQDDNDISVALVHGSVEVLMNHPAESETILLSPGKGITYSREINDYKKFSIDENEFLFGRITSWRNGILVFDGQDFDSFIKDISRWYGVKATIQGDPPKNWHVRASFENEYLNNVLDAISFNKEFTYDLSKKELKLMFN